jgi:aryl-alcohol dehydrogenase-like predicted oxidoreductase
VGLVAYSPLGRGVLSGAIRSAADIENLEGRRERYPRFGADVLDRNLTLVAQLRQRAEELGATAGTLALAWLLAQGEDIVPIPGTRRTANLEANVAAARTILDSSSVDELSALFPVGSAAGERYSAALAARLDQ